MTDGIGRENTLLVLGGGSDIGVATAGALVDGGTRNVILAARRPELLGEAAEQLQARGAATVATVSFDARAVDTHIAFVGETFDRFGDVDVALLTFGELGDQLAAEKDPSLAVDIAQTNYIGAMSVLLPLAERMRAQGHGVIVVLSSVAAERGRRSNFVYGSSKAGLDTFCQGLADELHGSGVRLIVVRPGFVRSKMTRGLEPAPLSTTPGAVAAAIVRALRRRADVVWVPAELRWVMTGLRHLPRPLFRKLEI